MDDVDLSNLQRQAIFTAADVGRSKVEAAAERLAALNPEICIQTHRIAVTAGYEGRSRVRPLDGKLDMEAQAD